MIIIIILPLNIAFKHPDGENSIWALFCNSSFYYCKSSVESIAGPDKYVLKEEIIFNNESKKFWSQAMEKFNRI